jgi:ribosomal protein S27AE
MNLVPEEKPVRPCPRCGAAARLWNVLPRTARAPEMQMFRCGACEYVDFVQKER